MKRKILLALLFVFTLVFVAACDKKTEPTDGTKPGTVITEPTEEPSETVIEAEHKGLFNGTLNLKVADADTRHTFFAAAEGWLIDNLYGGIPFYVANSYTLLADRVILPVEAFIPSYGWGTRYAIVTKDDSQVLMVDGEVGKAGEYTYRTWNNQSFSELNYWTYDDSVSADYIGLIEGGFYRMVLNDARNGWEFAPDLAASAPQPIGGEEIQGKLFTKVWRVKLRTGLEWAFHPDIDTTGFDMTLDANDFYWTYKEALTRNLFRAISGGGDFVEEIVGAEAYAELAAELYGGDDEPTPAELAELETLWSKVGIKKIDNHTLEFTFKKDKAEFDAYYSIGWSAMNQDLYEDLGNQYATGPLTIASSGEYIMTEHEDNKITRFVKNSKYPHADETVWTAEDIYIYDDASVAFQAFLDGKLESAGIPNERLDEFISDPRLLQTPDTTTWRLNLNFLQTVDKQKEQFPDSTYVPEPILGYKDFRKALFYILDREDLQKNWVPASGIGITYFSSGYYVEPESGIPYRSTDQGKAVSERFGEETWGYNKDLALSFLKSAVSQAIADGYYQAGTAANPTEIELEVRFMNLTVSEATALRADFVKESFENLVDDENHVVIKVDIKDTPFPGIYYDYMMTGDFDIAIGGISGSALNAGSFLSVFRSDDAGGFTLNWGFDSNKAEIDVEFTHEGERVIYTFSYDAIERALNGKVTVADGIEVPPVLVEGEYETWAEVKTVIEDFVDPAELPEFPGTGFEVIKDNSAAKGVWIVLPDTITREQLVTLLEEAGYEFFSTEDYEGDWASEFAGDEYDIVYAPDWVDDEVADELIDTYDFELPVDENGNVLNAILIY